VHGEVVRRLRSIGHNVEWIAETSPGSSDASILARADIGELVLITYDRDFGDLIFNHGLPRPKAIIFSRVGRVEPRFLCEKIDELLTNSFAVRHIHVLKKNGTRSTPFPVGV
jgi:predicted nuclease of predicted toxin-antitoxin system